jgi:hypothetical protein
MAALPHAPSPNNTLPPLSSDCPFILARKNSARLKNVISSVYFFTSVNIA